VKTPRAPLTHAELRIMRVLWSHPESTVNDVVERIVSPRLARNTVLTMLGILERKGYVAHKTLGRTFVYRPVVDRDAVRHRVVDDVVSSFFDDSPKSLVLQLLGSDRISKADLDHIRKLFPSAKQRHD
jgi:BlaI family transcriptional regulator, penicillinase repressor